MKKTIIASVLFVSIGIVMGVLLVSSFNSTTMERFFADEGGPIGKESAPVHLQANAKTINDAMVAASDAALPSVVSIGVITEQRNPHQGMDQFREFFKFFGAPKDEGENEETYKSRAYGSGVIVNTDGYIVTNNHVVESAMENGITVILSNKNEYKAKLIGTDPYTDLAVIKIDPDGDEIEPAHFGDMENIKIGQMVLAVGNPLGLTSTVTSGIVSAISRGSFGTRRGGYNIENYIQTDAAINPGNSGGGLFNLNGSLIGINTAIATRTGTYIGYGFAIPIDIVKSVVADLMDDGKVNRGYIGVKIDNVDATLAKSLGLEKAGGILINGVLDDSPADKAGIKQGDVILAIDGKDLKTTNELQGTIALHRAGDEIKVTLWRNDKKLDVKLTLEARDSEEEVATKDKEDDTDKEKPKENEPIEFDKLGFTIKNLSKQMKKDFEVDHGVYVQSVKRFSIADDRELIPNGIIMEADRKEVKSAEQLQDLIESKDSGDAILLKVKYKEITKFVAIELP